MEKILAVVCGVGACGMVVAMERNPLGAVLFTVMVVAVCWVWRRSKR